MPLKLSPTQIAFNAKDDGKFNKPFQEQIDFFKQKLDLPTNRYDDILKEAHDRSFVVAGAAKADLLADLHDAINKVLAEGKSIDWFKKNFESIVQERGWEGWTGSGTKAGRDWRTRIIYNTNLRASYAAGRYAQLTDPDMIKVRPYWKYVHDESVKHPRPMHKSWDGLVLKHDDPWWETHYPPQGYGCRCEAWPVKAKEYIGQSAPDNGTYEYEDRAGKTHTLPVGVDYGWDYAPGASVSSEMRVIVERKVEILPKPLADAFTQYIIAELKDFFIDGNENK